MNRTNIRNVYALEQFLGKMHQNYYSSDILQVVLKFNEVTPKCHVFMIGLNNDIFAYIVVVTKSKSIHLTNII